MDADRLQQGYNEVTMRSGEVRVRACVHCICRGCAAHDVGLESTVALCPALICSEQHSEDSTLEFGPFRDFEHRTLFALASVFPQENQPMGPKLTGALPQAVSN